MDMLLSLTKEIGVPMALMAFIIVNIFRLLTAMQAARGELQEAKASRIVADAEVVGNVSKLALLGQQHNVTLSEKLEEALSTIASTGIAVERLTNEAERLKLRVTDLERDNGYKKDEIERLQKRVNELQAELIQVRDQLETERRSNDALQSLVKQVQTERDNLAAQMGALSGQLEVLTERLKHLDTATLQTLSNEIDNIEHKESSHEAPVNSI